MIAASFLGIDWLRPTDGLIALGGLALLALAPFAILRARRALGLVFSPSLREAAASEFSATRRLLRAALAAGALLAGGVALAGPVLGYAERAVMSSGVDLVIAIDTSRSMLARDLRPDRLNRAKREVSGLLDQLSNDRVALLAFAGDARQVAPLTTDREALRDLLSRVQVDDNRVGGTDLGVALERALDLFDGRTGASEAIVLITDGEDLEGRGRAVAERAAASGIRVFVVGVGTSDGGKIPVTGPDGRESFLVGPDGVEVSSRLSGETLEALAEVTGGAYLSTEGSPTPLETLYRKRIAGLESRELEDGVRRVPYDRYQWPLALALALAIAESALRERGRKNPAGVQ
ncbi:VWA domain-containing protein [Engelhardtia mirabilis]|uniref:von Willebrand factor type A domain protein n=1 Tax=Engelhardtia mirabilis TaxID=2528011 RepID=A0A518BN75_9BACT|nr:von Willebrand factor type A domain protein [Planctomycetes bacterium Pla133]QDV02757.1 von Willebrand factor type A domain protein [Planctomycetes bacterium Pla86]